MGMPETSPLFALADRVLAVARHLRALDEAEDSRPTPLETAVLRYVDRHPGSSAREASDAALLKPSNFSRALRSLEEKGFVRREHDAHDARTVRLYPTDLAHENLRRLDAEWSTALSGVLSADEVAAVTASLESLETTLAERRRVGEPPRTPPAP